MYIKRIQTYVLPLLLSSIPPQYHQDVYNFYPNYRDVRYQTPHSPGWNERCSGTRFVYHHPLKLLSADHTNVKWVHTELAAAVTNAGGLGVIGGLGYTPKMLRGQVCVLQASRSY